MQRSHQIDSTSEFPNLEIMRLQLKWFNGSKGFGFLVPEDGSFDAFVHITTLQDAGLHAVGEGAMMDCEVYDGDKGKQVKSIVTVIDTGSVNLMPQAENADGSITMGGIVKWYKLDKGFGFIIADDGMKDIFVHQTLLENCEIDGLSDGQRVKVTVKTVNKGREAVGIEVID